MVVKTAPLQDSSMMLPEPLRLAVSEGPDAEPVIHECPFSYAIIGRSKGCQIRLKGLDVDFRHAYLQVIHGQVLCSDLMSKGGIRWNKERKRADWLTTKNQVRVGNHYIRLLEMPKTTGSDPEQFPYDFSPLSRYRGQLGPTPRVKVEFLNSSGNHSVWKLNRMLTLVGRHPGCKFYFQGKHVSRVHCSLLLLPRGLWVTDLLGRNGTHVNDSPVERKRLKEGDTVQVGKYQMRVQFESVADELAQDEADVVRTIEMPGSVTVFQAECHEDTLIVTPRGDARRFHYADVHTGAQSVQRLLDSPQFLNLVVDYGMAEYFGSVIIGVIIKLARKAANHGGRVVICNTSPKMQETLEEMRLFRLWPHYASREEALRSFHP